MADRRREPSLPGLTRRDALRIAAATACSGGVAARALPMATPAAGPPPAMRITIGANQGGGYDQVGRGIGRALVESGDASMVRYENRGGVGGTLALAQFVNANRGDPHALLVTGAVMLGAIVQGHPPVTLANVTPVALLIAEYNVIVVPAASPMRTMADLLTRLRRDPERVKWGGGSKGSVDQIAMAMLARAAGVATSSMNYVPFKGGGDAAAAVLGGFVDVAISGVSELEEFIVSGHLRALAITSPQRLPGVEAPTLREQGIDVEVANWRGVCAGPNVSPSAEAALIEAVQRATATRAWRAVVERNRWIDRPLVGDAFRQFIETDQRRLRQLMAGLGML